MHIFHLDRNKYIQDFHTTTENKEIYGEIFTPFMLINTMLDMMDPLIFSNKSNTFMDCGAGTGFFTMGLYWRLYDGLKESIICPETRSTHIITNMIYMSEIRDENIVKLQELFGKEANIIKGDFLSYKEKQFDYIIGNPPYNCNGIKKVPTNNLKDKKKDGKTIWIDFVKHSVDILKPKGELILIIPSIWMKPDKQKMYQFITNYKIKKLMSFSNTETNTYFKGHAQTPTCAIYLQKHKNDFTVDIYDKDCKTYITYPYYNFEPLPVFGASVVDKIRRGETDQRLDIIKTNMPPKNASLSNNKKDTHPYINIRTAKILDNDVRLVTEYSNMKLFGYGKKKLVLPHKMYGFPFVDTEGTYGISNRDVYVLCSEDERYLERLATFFKTKTALYLFEATRYRMKFLEKYIFDIIPDICNMHDFPIDINDDTIAEYFKLTELEIRSIQTLHKKQYTFHYGIT